MQTHRLVCHPDTPAKCVTAVRVAVAVEARDEALGMHRVSLVYFVDAQPAAVIWPPCVKPDRADGLWRTTCFELFSATACGGYLEFNFSPSSEWAAYRFATYRSAMATLAVDPPCISASTKKDQPIVKVSLRLPDAFDGPMGLSAVIEETDGTKSYWALRHPPGPPDFHHPDCFALTLPPPERV